MFEPWIDLALWEESTMNLHEANESCSNSQLRFTNIASCIPKEMWPKLGNPHLQRLVSRYTGLSTPPLHQSSSILLADGRISSQFSQGMQKQRSNGVNRIRKLVGPTIFKYDMAVSDDERSARFKEAIGYKTVSKIYEHNAPILSLDGEPNTAATRFTNPQLMQASP
jgi:hypothetical protein